MAVGKWYPNLRLIASLLGYRRSRRLTGDVVLVGLDHTWLSSQLLMAYVQEEISPIGHDPIRGPYRMRGVHPAKRHNVTLIDRDTLEGAMCRPVRHVVDCTSDLNATEVDTDVPAYCVIRSHVR